jgi:hypothetical protein
MQGQEYNKVELSPLNTQSASRLSLGKPVCRPLAIFLSPGWNTDDPSLTQILADSIASRGEDSAKGRIGDRSSGGISAAPSRD